MAASTRHLHHRFLAGTAAAARGSAALPENPLSVSPDEHPDLAKFLLAEEGDTSWRARLRRAVAGHRHSDAYFLALEPPEIRNERITMLSEAYSIFGGLFLGGTWILFEWGSPAFNDAPVDAELSRNFAVVMALTICCNLFLTLWGSIVWIMSIVHGSSEVLAVESRNIIGFCNLLLTLTGSLVTLGFVLGAQVHFGGTSAEAIVCIVVASLLQVVGAVSINDLLLAVSPLKVLHQPTWFRALACPQTVFTRKGRETLRRRARDEATRLAARRGGRDGATKDDRDGVDSEPPDGGSLGILLRRAAARLDRGDDVDVAPFAARLRGDWFEEARHLEGRDAEFLARYMPYRLAEEVHALVRAGPAESL